MGFERAWHPHWAPPVFDDVADVQLSLWESCGSGAGLHADAPVDALQGVGTGDAEHLQAAFNIKTLRDLGTDKYFLWAQAIAKLAE
jgi:hypothetical protein